MCAECPVTATHAPINASALHGFFFFSFNSVHSFHSFSVCSFIFSLVHVLIRSFVPDPCNLPFIAQHHFLIRSMFLHPRLHKLAWKQSWKLKILLIILNPAVSNQLRLHRLHHPQSLCAHNAKPNVRDLPSFVENVVINIDWIN